MFFKRFFVLVLFLILIFNSVFANFYCTGEIDSNSINYVGDDVGMDSNLPKILVDFNTSTKCEWYCKSGYYKGTGVDENKCLPNNYFCIGNISPNAILYTNDNVELDSNLQNILVDYNTLRKCEWYCKEGYARGNGYDFNNCVQVLERTCDGNIDPNSEIYAGDDVNILVSDNRINILVEQNSNLKCEWHCKQGYYLEDTNRGYICSPEIVEEFFCTGLIDANAILFTNDDKDLVSDLNNVLVDSNTIRKCEWHCKSGYYLGSVSGVGVCLPNMYSCKGVVNGAIIYLGDDSGLTSDLNSVLVETNTSRKCEYHCAKYYKKDGNVCVLSIVSDAVCGNAERSYTPSESFFGSYSLCSVGVSSITNPTLGSEIGSIVNWECVSDTNINCSATRVSSKYVPIVEGGDSSNSIQLLTSRMLEDGNLEVTLKCLKTTMVDLNIIDYLSKNVYSSNQNKIDCTTSENTHKITLNNAPTMERSLIIRASMGGNEADCSTCDLDYYIDYTPITNLQNGENFSGLIVFGVIGLLFAIVVVVVIIKLRKN